LSVLGEGEAFIASRDVAIQPESVNGNVHPEIFPRGMWGISERKKVGVEWNNPRSLKKSFSCFFPFKMHRSWATF